MAFSAANCAEVVYFSSFKHQILDYHGIKDVEPMQEHIMCTTIYIILESSSVWIWSRNVYVFHLQETANAGWQTALHNKRAESKISTRNQKPRS